VWYGFCLPDLYVVLYDRIQIDVVTCHFDRRVYVRKSIEKRFALKARDVLLFFLALNSSHNHHLPAMLTPTRT